MEWITMSNVKDKVSEKSTLTHLAQLAAVGFCIYAQLPTDQVLMLCGAIGAVGIGVKDN